MCAACPTNQHLSVGPHGLMPHVTTEAIVSEAACSGAAGEANGEAVSEADGRGLLTADGIIVFPARSSVRTCPMNKVQPHDETRFLCTCSRTCQCPVSCKSTCTCACLRTCPRTCPHTCLCARPHMCLCTHRRTCCLHVFTHAHAHVQMHTWYIPPAGSARLWAKCHPPCGGWWPIPVSKRGARGQARGAWPLSKNHNRRDKSRRGALVRLLWAHV